jgi:FixJ family two-component response regulator
MSKSNFLNRDLSNPKQVYVLDTPSLERDRVVRFLGKSAFAVTVFSTPFAFFKKNDIQQSGPSVLIANIELPNIAGVDFLEQLKIAQLNIPVIFYGKAQHVPQGVAAVKRGALNFLLMPANQERIIELIEDGLQISAELQNSLSPDKTLQSKLSLLSPREQEVFFLLIRGYSNAELVSALGISLDTAKQYKSSLMRKLEAKSLSQLISLATMNMSHVPPASHLEIRPS